MHTDCGAAEAAIDVRDELPTRATMIHHWSGVGGDRDGGGCVGDFYTHALSNNLDEIFEIVSPQGGISDIPVDPSEIDF